MFGLLYILIIVGINTELEILQMPTRKPGGEHPLVFFVEERHIARSHAVACRLRTYILVEQVVSRGFVVA